MNGCFDGGAASVANPDAECSGLFDSCPRHNAKFLSSNLDDYARGVAAERARVVADLRTHKWHPGGAKGAVLPERAADRYERGEHDKEGA